MTTKQFLVRRDQLAVHEIVTEPRRALAPGDVELELDRFGLTSNNVTYGLLGDALAYWKFFPEDRPGWGRLPVWGFGTVTRSTVDGVAVGERLYGYFSMSTHLVVQPGRVDDAGFIDAAPHRRELAAVYNQYRRTTHDPSYRADTEPYQVVLRPLVATAYFLTDYLEARGYFDAEAVVISSASSKLAYNTALLLGAPARQAGRALVGLTSARNLGFVTRLGLYDRVLTYDDIGSLAATPSVFVDMAGSTAVRAAVHRRLGAALRHSLVIGATHWTERDAVELPGPAPETFFAPARIKQRTAEWSPAEVQRRIAGAWATIMGPLLDPSRGWLRLVFGTGDEAVTRAYDALVAGQAHADEGYVLSLGDPADPA